MRILHITKWFIPYRGGIETVVEQVASGLIERGIETQVLTCHHTPHLQDDSEQIDQIPVRRTQSFGNAFGTPLSITYPYHYRKMAEWADIIHFHSPFPVGELVFPWANLHGKKSVVTFHANPGNTRWRRLERLYRPIIRRVLERVDRIVVTSPQMRDTPDLLAGLRDKCRIIPLAANIDLPEENGVDVRALRRKHDLHHDNVVLAVGRLIYYKGFRYLVKAMQNVDASLVIVGRGEDQNDLQQQINELGLADRVHLAGYVSSDELVEYYTLADLFVLPSITAAEAFGIVQVEAMVHGLPVINTNLPTGVPFVSQDGETGITVSPRDPQRLAEAINQLLSDEEFRVRLSENARTRATQFSREAMINKHVSLYEELWK